MELGSGAHTRTAMSRFNDLVQLPSFSYVIMFLYILLSSMCDVSCYSFRVTFSLSSHTERHVCWCVATSPNGTCSFRGFIFKMVRVTLHSLSFFHLNFIPAKLNCTNHRVCVDDVSPPLLVLFVRLMLYK